MTCERSLKKLLVASATFSHFLCSCCDGHINAYSSEGNFLGQLRAHGNQIVIDGLWAISFPPSTSSINPDRLYFTAGPDDEADGIFGYIMK